LKRKDGEIKKPMRDYRRVSGKAADNWKQVCELCQQARMLNDKLMQLGSEGMAFD